MHILLLAITSKRTLLGKGLDRFTHAKCFKLWTRSTLAFSCINYHCIFFCLKGQNVVVPLGCCNYPGAMRSSFCDALHSVLYCFFGVSVILLLWELAWNSKFFLYDRACATPTLLCSIWYKLNFSSFCKTFRRL